MTPGRKLLTWQIIALSMFWWGFALWMYMFVVLMIPGQVLLHCDASGTVALDAVHST